MSVSKTRPAASQDAPAEDAHAPRRLTPTENILLTLKVVGGLGAVGAVLWAANLWIVAK